MSPNDAAWLAAPQHTGGHDQTPCRWHAAAVARAQESRRPPCRMSNTKSSHLSRRSKSSCHPIVSVRCIPGTRPPQQTSTSSPPFDMSLLDVGSRCQECTLVDFLPFTCPSCSFVFCRAHVQSHACPAAQSAQPGEPSRKRVKGTCAFASCQEETLESVGGFETSEEESIARQVRCVCGGAFCISYVAWSPALTSGIARKRRTSVQHHARLMLVMTLYWRGEKRHRRFFSRPCRLRLERRG